VLVLTGRGRQQLSLLNEEELAGCVVMPDLPSAVDRLLRQQPLA
jgi:hypothetical protein